MSQESTASSEQGEPALNRRRMLQGMAATGATAGIAGCSNLFGGDNEQSSNRLEAAIVRDGIDEYDQAASSSADDATVFNLVYDGLRAQGADGTFYNWMATEFAVTDSNSVGRRDYESYMREITVASFDGEQTSAPQPQESLAENNLILIYHPDDVPAQEGDTVRVLTRDDAEAAVNGGVYGVKVEGRLREGIEFHNGEELTAENVIRSYDRYIGSVNEGQLFDSFLYARAPDGADGYTFELYGQEADATAGASLPPFDIFPSRDFDTEPGELDPREGGEIPVGTGPYEIEEYDEGNRLLLTRTDNYWVEELGLDTFDWWDGSGEFPAAPTVDEINIRFVPNASQRGGAMIDGELDIAYDLTTQARDQFAESADYTVGAAFSTGFQFMQFPIVETDTGGALSYPEVRQAVSELIPRQEIVEVVAGGWGEPARVPFPKPAAGLGTAADQYEDLYDREWTYPVEPDQQSAQNLIDQTNLDTPIEITLETNADDQERQDKLQLVVDELNNTDLFDATLETPASLGDWTSGTLYTEGARQEYAKRNASATIGIAAGFDPSGYAEAIRLPTYYNGCCNFFFPEGSFDGYQIDGEPFVDYIRNSRFNQDAIEDPDLRRQRYDNIWEKTTEVMSNTILDYSQDTIVAGPDVDGFAAYPDRRQFLSWGLWAPYDEQHASLNR